MGPCNESWFWRRLPAPAPRWMRRRRLLSRSRRRRSRRFTRRSRPAASPAAAWSSAIFAASRRTTRTARRINAIVVVNPEALKQADDLDRRAAQGGFAGPLHCVPMIVKDNFETIGLAERERIAGAGGVRLEQGRVSGEAHQGGRRDRARQIEHGRVGVHAVRDAQLDPSRLHEEPVRARSRDRRIERRHGRVGRRELRRRGPRLRYGQLDSRPVVASGARRAFDRRWG